ncbi:MAG TPA: ABC transporter permease [Chloroflexota bacterium]
MRTLHSLGLIVAAVVSVFLVVRILPGDPVTAITGEYPVPAAYAAEIRASYGIDKPLPIQLGLYAAALLRGDLGFSFKNQKSVGQLLKERGANTLLLGGSAFMLATLAGVTLGITAATRRTRKVDHAIRTFAALSYAAPVFWVGQLLILLLAVQWKVLPVSGMNSVRGVTPGFGQVVDVAQHLLLPAIVLALPVAAIHTRILRVSMIEALGTEYVKTARAKGLPGNLVVMRHAFRNALLPLITVIALEIPTLFAGSVLVETVFAWPGLGRLLFDSIGARDYPVVEAMLLMVTLCVIAANWIADVLYGQLDPRIRRA